MQKEVVMGSALVLFGLVVIIGSAVSLYNSGNLTGKVVSEEFTVESAENSESSGSICSLGTCNPDNSLEICSGGKWSRCSSGQVCSVGKCVRPLENTAKITSGIGGSSSDSGGSSSSSSTSTSTTAISTETSRTIGEIEGTVIEEIVQDEKLVFLTDGIERSLKVTSLGVIDANFVNADGSSFTISAGQSQFIDYDGNGENDIEIILKSVGLASEKAKVLLNEI